MANRNHQQCQALRRQGHSIGQIARLLRLSKSTVYWHVKGILLTRVQRDGLRDQKRQLMSRVNAKRRGIPVKTQMFRQPPWSASLVHLIAHLSFDGRVDRYGCHYYSRSQVQAAHMKRLIAQLLGVAPALRQRTNGIWVVSYYHVGLAAWLAQKERELLATIQTRKGWQQQWLRALFDDEGHVHVSGPVRRVRASQKDARILQCAQRFLQRFQIDSRIDRRAQAVEVRGRSNLFNFQKRINFSLGLLINPARKNGLWRQPLEKRKLLELALESYETAALS